MEQLCNPPDLIVEAATLRNALEDALGGLIADCAGMNPSPSDMAAHSRISRILERAERRLLRREFAEIGDSACSSFGCVDGCGDCTPYTLDAYTQPGEVVVVVDGHPSYIAESYHQAEEFRTRLLSAAPILLLPPSDAEALIARVLARIAAQETPDRSWLQLGEELERREQGDTRHMYNLPNIP